MKIIAVYDTETKTCEMTMDGKLIENFVGMSISKYLDDKYDCHMSSVKKVGDINEMQSWSCYAAKEELKLEIQKAIFNKNV